MNGHAQFHAARGLLEWTQAALTLDMIENETVCPHAATLAAIRHALEAGGVQFLDENGVGVRFVPH